MTGNNANLSKCTNQLYVCFFFALAGIFQYNIQDNVYRCVVCREGKAIEMSADHKPEDDIEHTRIKNAGGKVTIRKI